MDSKELLRKLGEETIYTAKGHFKACDIRRNLVTGTIWICAALMVVRLVDMPATIAKALSLIGLFGTMALLRWDAGEGKDYRAKHKQVAEEYLALHKRIRAAYSSDELTKEQLNDLTEAVISLDKSLKPEIPETARKLAKTAIIKKRETDNWFSNSKEP